ncbi:response regulator, partial [Draconibacterium sp.]|nr:response regulator [Draconibacterium sp.]
VTNGLDAIKAVNNNQFDLVLMDIMLPEMNGFEVTEKIRNLEAERGTKEPVPIIALTANTLDNDREKCLNAGMNEYLSKPFTALELLEKIEKFVRLAV